MTTATAIAAPAPFAHAPEVLGWVRDGVRWVWAPSPTPAAHVAVMFRVGKADETLATTGITHLVEHLALDRFGVAAQHNGSTAVSSTQFTRTGTTEEVLQFLPDIAQSLADLPLGRLSLQREILRAEERSRGVHPIDELAFLRYGPAGYGLIGYEEHLDHVTPEQVVGWAAERFTAQNAVVLLLTEELPAQLPTLLLPSGTAQPAPVPRPVPPALPAVEPTRNPGTGVLVEIDRSPAARLAVELLQRRLMRVLRHERGLCYDVSETWIKATATTALAALISDAVPGKEAELMTGFVGELQRLAEQGPDPAELAELRQEAAGYPDAPPHILAMLTAEDLLLGRALEPMEQMKADRMACPAEEVHAALRAIAGRALYTIPVAPDHLDLPVVAQQGRQPATGETFVERTERFGVRVLVVGEDRVTMSAHDHTVTIPVADIAGMYRTPDGGRHILGLDGYRIIAEPTLCDSFGVDEALDRLVPRHRWLDVPRAPEDVPAREVLRIPFPPQDSRRARLRLFGLVVAVALIISAISTSHGLLWMWVAFAATLLGAVRREQGSFREFLPVVRGWRLPPTR